MRIISTFLPCKQKGCKGIAMLQDMVYHFLNTGKPYMLRHCSVCSTWYLVLIEKEAGVER